MSALPRRLFWRVYLTLLASLVAVAVLMGASWWLMGENPRGRWGAFHIHLSGPILPASDEARGAIAAAIDRLGEEIGGDISVYAADGALVASHGPPIALEGSERGGPVMRPPTMRIDLADGRILLARPRPPPHPGLHILAMALLVAGGVALTVYPIAGRLTRRLEGLRSGVESWGAGALSLRLDETGNDEVAVVARAFNAAAGRVEDLLTSQKALLANASHELRSPLARLRMAIELWQERQATEIHEEIVRNLAEIDELVAEILLASRLNHGAPDARAETRIDLVGLAAEEAAPFEASVVRRAGRRRGRDRRRREAAAPPDPQSPGERRPARTPADRGRGDEPTRGRANRRLRSRRWNPAGRAGAGVRAVLPARRAQRGRRRLGTRPVAGAPDRPAPRRDGVLRRGAGRRQSLCRRSCRGFERRLTTASATGARRDSRRSRAGSCGRASRPRHISPAAGRGGISNRQAPRAAPASPPDMCRGR